MIYPTPRPILLALLGAPIALVIGLMQPQLWTVAVAWAVFILLLIVLDAFMGRGPGKQAIELDVVRTIGIGEKFDLKVVANGVPKGAEIAIEANSRIAPNGRLEGQFRRKDGQSFVTIPLQADRRGMAPLGKLWLRWRGTLGMVWKQKIIQLDRSIAVLPSLASVRQEGINLFFRDAAMGLRMQQQRGIGTEFQSLTEFQAGMDRRAIDWKQSARHVKLHAKEYQTEKNNRIVLAIDCGRTMCEPLAGIPKLDRAVSAALLNAYVALKMDDRVSLFAFAAKPELKSETYTASRHFAALQGRAASIEYRFEECNYTLALATLGAQLDRRSLIVLFTEFSDPTSADLMIKAAGKLVDKHLILAVVFGEEELEAVQAAMPETPTDVTRSNIAAGLLRDRRIAIARLRRMGVQVIEAHHDKVNAKLIDTYLKIKRRGML
jgi:uncharacterized protein (DUF58 family)